MANSSHFPTHTGSFTNGQGAKRHQLTLIVLFSTDDLVYLEGRFFTLSHHISGLIFEWDGVPVADVVRFTISDVRQGKLSVSSAKTGTGESSTITIVSRDGDEANANANGYSNGQAGEGADEGSGASIISQVEVVITEPAGEAASAGLAPQAPLPEIPAASAQEEAQPQETPQETPQEAPQETPQEAPQGAPTPPQETPTQTQPAESQSNPLQDDETAQAGGRVDGATLFSYPAGGPIDSWRAH